MSSHVALSKQYSPRTLLVLGVVAVLFMLCSVIAFSPQTHAAWGSGGSGVGGSGAGYWTSNGFGWKRFSKTGGGPSGGFRDGTSWSSVQNACRNYSGSTVWVHVVRNSSGMEKSFNYSGASYNRDRPAAGGDPYMYNAAGAYSPQGSAWQPHVINIVSQVHSAFLVEHSAFNSHWGIDVGWFCDGTKTTQWTIRGESYIKKGATSMTGRVQGTTTAAPGDRLNWFHDMRNNGPQNMDRQITYQVDKTGFSNGWNSIIAPSGRASGTAGSLFVVINATNGAPYTIYDVTQNDVGRTLCQRVSWVQGSWNSSGRAWSAPACAAIPYNYRLVPTIENITDGGMIESDAGDVPLRGRVTNTGATKSHTNIQWRITQLRYAPGATIANRSGGVNSALPCNYFGGNNSCSTLASGTATGGYGRNASVPYDTQGSLGDEPVGTRLCFAMSVQRNSSSSTAWRHSALRCLTVGKKPKVQVYGGDLIVGRGYAADGSKIIADVTTSVSAKSGTYYGSWSEYGIILSGTVSGMASGSGYAGGATTSGLCTSLSLLTLANASSAAAPTCNAGQIGNYVLATPSPKDSVAARFAVTGSSLTGNVDVRSLTSRTVYSGRGTINLSSSVDIPAGKWVVINAPNANVRITGDIRYTNASLTRTSQIPQLVIIARNIVIDDSVQQVDAWLLATGQDTSPTARGGILNTCDASISEPTGLTSNVCDRQLTINGPVMANHLYLYRTAGSGVGDDSGTPAEIFNLRPDAYMWASNYAGLESKARTVYEAELPPRF